MTFHVYRLLPLSLFLFINCIDLHVGPSTLFFPCIASFIIGFAVHHYCCAPYHRQHKRRAGRRRRLTRRAKAQRRMIISREADSTQMLMRLLDRLYHDRGSQRPFRIETTNVALKGGAAGHHRLPLPPSVAQDFAALFSQTTLPLVTVPLTLLKRATCVFSRLPRSLPLCVLPRIRIQTSQPRLALLPAPPTSPLTFHPSPSRPLCHSGALLASQIVPVVSIIVTILRPLYLSLSSETPSVSPASEDLPENSEVPARPLTFRDPLPGPSRRHRHEGSPQPNSTLAYRVGLGQTVLDDMLPPIEEIESPVPESPRRVTRNTYFWNEEYYNDPRNNRERALNRLRPTMGVIINFPEPKPKTRRRWLRALRKFCCTSVEEEDE